MWKRSKVSHKWKIKNKKKEIFKLNAFISLLAYQSDPFAYGNCFFLLLKNTAVSALTKFNLNFTGNNKSNGIEL